MLIVDGVGGAVGGKKYFQINVETALLVSRTFNVVEEQKVDNSPVR